LEVSVSGYYAAHDRPISRRAEHDVGLRHAIRVAHAESRGTYGSPRLLGAVRAQGHRVGRNRVIRLMRLDGLRARRRRRFRVTTDSAHPWPVAPNHLQRQFAVAAPNRVWAADITYVATADGWLYLAVIIDLYSRRVVGWATRSTLHTELVVAALHLALGRRAPQPGLIHHSDQGFQYASERYRALLQAHGAVQSMSRKGNCWDNAVVESFFSSLKRELEAETWPNRLVATQAIGDYIDRFYNRIRLHSTLAYHTPCAFETEAVM
jgi:putative transposase